MSTTTSSTSLNSPSPDWPDNAVPRKWVEKLFETMAAFYGSRFADLWRDADVEVTKRVWGIELQKISAQQMKAGRENLAQLGKAPTLPEFIEHCKRTRIEAAASASPQLADGTRASAETVGANMPQIRKAAARAAKLIGSVAWAYERIAEGRARNGSELTAEVRRHCEDAIISQAGAQAANRNDDFAKIRIGVLNRRNEVMA